MAGWSAPLCGACHCDVDEEFPGQGQRYPPVVPSERPDSLDELRVSSPVKAPKVRGFPTYSSGQDQPLLGVPIREGFLWHLSAGDRFEEVSFSLYVNGFAFTTGAGLEASVSLSPFTLVRNCRFQAGQCAALKSFKVALADGESCCFFAVRAAVEREAEEIRSDWVLAISHTVLLITDSLLPQSALSCQPAAGVEGTSRRLVAGYLIHRDDEESMSVLFCELNAQCGHVARVTLYENELCQTRLFEVEVTEETELVDIFGINSACFAVGGHQFGAQTPSERKLWLRALSNVKVKVANHAPDPSEDDIQHYRISIGENIEALKAMTERRITSDPLVTPCKRKAPLLTTCLAEEIDADEVTSGQVTHMSL